MLLDSKLDDNDIFCLGLLFHRGEYFFGIFHLHLHNYQMVDLYHMLLHMEGMLLYQLAGSHWCLSQIYTNHSIRATGATILGRNCSINVFHQRKNKLWETLSQVLFVESNHLNYPQ